MVAEAAAKAKAQASATPGAIPYLSHGIGVDQSLFQGEQQQSLGLTGDSPITRVVGQEPAGTTGDFVLRRSGSGTTRVRATPPTARASTPAPRSTGRGSGSESAWRHCSRPRWGLSTSRRATATESHSRSDRSNTRGTGTGRAQGGRPVPRIRPQPQSRSRRGGPARDAPTRQVGGRAGSPMDRRLAMSCQTLVGSRCQAASSEEIPPVRARARERKWWAFATGPCPRRFRGVRWDTLGPRSPWIFTSNEFETARRREQVGEHLVAALGGLVRV